jgi:hypothetical protein
VKTADIPLLCYINVVKSKNDVHVKVQHPPVFFLKLKWQYNAREFIKTYNSLKCTPLWNDYWENVRNLQLSKQCVLCKMAYSVKCVFTVKTVYQTNGLWTHRTQGSGPLKIQNVIQTFYKMHCVVCNQEGLTELTSVERTVTKQQYLQKLQNEVILIIQGTGHAHTTFFQ